MVPSTVLKRNKCQSFYPLITPKSLEQILYDTKNASVGINTTAMQIDFKALPYREDHT